MSVSTFVGVDGGGTTVRAVLVDDQGRVLARARAGGTVLSAASVSPTVDAVENVVRRLLSMSGGTDIGAPAPLVPAALWAGLAGAGREDARAGAEAELRARGLAADVRVGTDAQAAFEDAFGPGPGILVIAGTGSVALGRARTDAPLVRVGGWGAALGDEGSAYWLTMRALACVARAEDGRAAPTALRDAVLERLGLERPGALIGWVAAATKRDVAHLAPAVFETAALGDAVAAALVTDGAAALRDHVVAMLDRICGDALPVVGGADTAHAAGEAHAAGGADAVHAPPGLALAGGLLDPGGPMRPILLEISAPLGLEVLDGPVDAALGAARLAQRSGG